MAKFQKKKSFSELCEKKSKLRISDLRSTMEVYRRKSCISFFHTPWYSAKWDIGNTLSGIYMYTCLSAYLYVR